MKLLKSIAALSAATVAMPALAVTFDAYTSFNGTNGAGGFFYGSTDGTTFTAFDTTGTNGGCAYNESAGTCLYSSTSPFGVIPTAEKGGSYFTVAPSGARIKLHPGNSADTSVYGVFTAATAGSYSYDIALQSIGMDSTNGVGVTFVTLSSSGVATVIVPRTVFSYTGGTATSGKLILGAGESVGAILDNNGFYGGDSTALSFQVSVPEPATWGMMALGFGLVGVGMRRRRVTAVAA